MSEQYLMLTEMWHANLYVEVGEYISSAGWLPRETAEFCAYFCRYMGTNQLDILYKFM
jgi:hypothetical protein